MLAISERRAETDPDLALRVDALEATRRLPERLRAVVTLHYWEGWTLECVADILGVTDTHVQWLHRVALARLRDMPQIKALA